MSGRRGDAPQREMVTLTDPNGEDFETGDLRTLNTLRAQGYTLKGKETYETAVEKLAPPPAPEPGSK